MKFTVTFVGHYLVQIFSPWYWRGTVRNQLIVNGSKDSCHSLALGLGLGNFVAQWTLGGSHLPLLSELLTSGPY